MKSNIEFQQDSLDAFRFALSRRVRRQRDNGERVHGLALRAGDWLGRGYAPLEPGGRAGTPRRRLETAFTSPIWREAKRTGKVARRVPNDLWQVNRLIAESYSWPSANKQGLVQATGAAVKCAPMTYSYYRAITYRSGAITAKEKRSFAPFPRTQRQQGLDGVQTETQSRDSTRRNFYPREGDNSVSSSLTGPRQAEESHYSGRNFTIHDTGSGYSGSEMPSAGGNFVPGTDFGDALEEYFFRQSRLAPSGGAAFDPRLSPLWAGLKLPG